MRFYHRSPFVETIVREGFKDATGTYDAGIEFTGVWLSDIPLDAGDIRARYHAGGLLAVDIPEAVVGEYEWAPDEQIGQYREWLIPAAVVNQYQRELVDEFADC